MNIEVNNINSKEDLINFIKLLIKDFDDNSDEWENQTIVDYLNAMRNWINDMNGYYENHKIPIPKDINWNFIANVLYASKIYE
jgi:hypothetical protein